MTLPDPALAQVGATSLYTTGGTGSGPSTAILIAVGAVLVLLLAYAIVKNRGSAPGGPSFSKGAFRRAARAAGLAEDELRSLEEYARAIGLSKPDFVFRNPQKLEAFFQDAYKQIDKVSVSESDAEERKSLFFSARERLTHASSGGGGVRSTRQLGKGTPLTFIAPGEESYPTVILAVEPGGIAVEPVADSYGELLRFRRGTRLNCFFYARGHEGYQFETKVAGWEKIGGKDAMLLLHNDAVGALPARRHARREMRAPCSFYRLSVVPSAAKGRGGRSSAKVEGSAYAGTIVDISAGGIGIQSSNPLAEGEYAKIVFSAGSESQSAFAKVIRMSNARTLGGVMHLQFVKISRQGLNAILSYVYGYAE